MERSWIAYAEDVSVPWAHPTAGYDEDCFDVLFLLVRIET